MQLSARHLFLDHPGLDGISRLITDRISLAEGKPESWETITRLIKFDDPIYGEVEISRSMLDSMVQNFQSDVYGQLIAVDIAHMSSDGAAGFIRELQIDGPKLRGRIEWTEFGRKAVIDRGYRYFSAEYHENYKDPESGKKHGPTLLAAALTTRPRIKKLDPINPDRLRLSFDGMDGDQPAISPRLTSILLEDYQTMKDQLIKKFALVLVGIKALSEALRKQFATQFEAAIDGVTDEAQGNIILAAFQNTVEGTAKQLAEQNLPESIKLDFSGLKDSLSGMSRGLSDDDVKRILSEQQQTIATTAAEKQLQLDANVKLFSDAIAGQKGFSDELKKQLTDGTADLITAEMIAAQVKALSDNQIRMGNQLSAQAKLAQMGFTGPNGHIHISVDHGNEIKSLQETVDKRLGLEDKPHSMRYQYTGGQLPAENKRFAEKVLAQFDAEHVVQLHAEHKMLAAGDGVVSDVAVPSVFERTVLREALYQLVGLQFVDTGTLTFASSALIPYSYRDTAAAGRSNTRVYEGGSIPRAGVIQTSETAYPIPQKLSFEVSDELRYLTGAGILNWDSVSENQQNASRIIGEDLEQMIFNEVLRSADEYGAVAVTTEDIELQADGSDTIFITANFPIVRPRAVYDLQGNQVGSTVNAIAVSYDSTALEEYDGTGTQAAGNYYVLDYNLGEIYLVDEAGAVQTPADATAYTISYSYSTNVYKFDSDLGSDTAKIHWNDFLYRYGLRKAVIEDDRYHMANFGLLSGTLMTQIEQAEQFGANSLRPGTDLSANGNLGRIKDVPNFKTSAPGLNMGDLRCVIGERSQTRLRMMKGWQMGELENQKDSNGRFTGKKEAYGDQFIILHTPTQLKRAYTSILVYSATGRVAR